MAELQTLSAALDVAKIAISTALFIRKVKNAEALVSELRDSVLRLRDVLRSVEQAIAAREKRNTALVSAEDLQTVQRIRHHHASCILILRSIEDRVGGFDSDGQIGGRVSRDVDQYKLTRDVGTNSPISLTLVQRVQAVLKNPGTARLQAELEARINNLQTCLTLLQLSDHAYTHSTLGSNHDEVLGHLKVLGQRLEDGNKLLARLLAQQKNSAVHEVPSLVLTTEDADEDAIISLRRELEIGEEMHSKYSTEYQPDERSIDDRRDSPSEVSPPSIVSENNLRAQARLERGTGMPAMRDNTTPGFEADEDEVYDCLEMLDSHIVGHRDRSAKAQELGQLNQAEHHLKEAIKYYNIRATQYNVPFENRHLLQEELASICLKKKEWAEAIELVTELLNDGGDEYARARQLQLLASIHYDRHANNQAQSLTTPDLENARRYSMKEFLVRKTVLLDSGPLDDEHRDCILLLVKILEELDKGVEAMGYKRILADRHMSTCESHRSTDDSNYPRDSIYSGSNSQSTPGDSHQSLIEAIAELDGEQIRNLLRDSEIEVDQPCCKGKTLLIHAVEKSDESMVNRLLDAQVGADVNARNKDGITAMHRAAALGFQGIVACLLRHDAELEAQDKRGETPLIKAIKNDQTVMVELLCRNGANMLTKNENEWSALHHAARQDGIEMINLILDLAPEVRHESDKAGMTPLHHCVEQELLEKATALLDHRNSVDVNAVDSVPRSALYFAAKFAWNPKRGSIVQMLLDHGAKFREDHPPLKWEDYPELRIFRKSRRDLRRIDSVSTVGTVGTTSTAQTRLSRIFSGRMHIR